MQKKFFLIPSLLLSFGLSAATLDGHLFTPNGFDTNDPVEVVVSGVLPDLCHRNPSFDIDRENRIFLIQMNAYYVPQNHCRKLALPYMEKVSLGMLPAGTYTVRLMDFRTVLDEKTVTVLPARNELRDNFNYGNVTGIRDLGKGKLELLGTNPVDCLVFESLEAEVQGKIIVLMPHFREAGECQSEPKSFSLSYQIPKHLKGEILIHVRVMDGRSFNYILRKK